MTMQLLHVSTRYRSNEYQDRRKHDVTTCGKSTIAHRYTTLIIHRLERYQLLETKDTRGISDIN